MFAERKRGSAVSFLCEVAVERINGFAFMAAKKLLNGIFEFLLLASCEGGIFNFAKGNLLRMRSGWRFVLFLRIFGGEWRGRREVVDVILNFRLKNNV